MPAGQPPQSDGRTILVPLRHANPYDDNDRKMAPRDVWADGYRAGREDAK